MKQKFGLLGAASFIAIVTLFNPAARPAYAQSSHANVGESQCENCHDSTHEALKNLIGPDGNPTDPVTVWKADKHSQAFNNLVGNDRAVKAAAVAHMAAGDTQNDGSMCLTCHATGVGGNNPPDPSEGVSCEAC